MRRRNYALAAMQIAISIHAPREGCDLPREGASRNTKISIHAPREGCDRCRRTTTSGWLGFQSTHPVRGATPQIDYSDLQRIISIHAPREGCDTEKAMAAIYATISIHAPREGCDGGEVGQTVCTARFQSTHPVRGATCAPRAEGIYRAISIHAPREGCDRLPPLDARTGRNFNPRTP